MYPTKHNQTTASTPTERSSQRFVIAFIVTSVRLLRHRVQFKIPLWRNSEGVRDAIEKCEHRRDIDSFGNLRIGPAVLTKRLHVFGGCAIGGFGHLRHIVQKRTLCLAQRGFVQFAVNQCLYRLFVCSLNPQEVRMRVQSIRATVEIRDPTCDGLFGASGQMALGKMHRIAELKDVSEKIRSMAETLQDTGHLLPARFLAPFIVDGGYV